MDSKSIEKIVESKKVVGGIGVLGVYAIAGCVCTLYNNPSLT